MFANLKIGIRDLVLGALRWPLFTSLAWRDIRRRYKGTVIGPFWLSLSTGIFILAFALIYGNLFGQDMSTYLPFLAAGFLPWMLFSTIVGESCTAFIDGKNAITNWQFPYSILVYQLVCKNLIVFFHNLVILLIVNLIYVPSPSWNMLWAPVGLVLLSLNGLWIGLLCATICSRFRDFHPIVTSFLQITMFVTPILWVPNTLGKHRGVFVDANFIYHLISNVRDPFLGKAPSALSLVVSSAGAILGMTVALVLFGRYRRRLPFWI